MSVSSKIIVRHVSLLTCALKAHHQIDLNIVDHVPELPDKDPLGSGKTQSRRPLK